MPALTQQPDWLRGRKPESPPTRVIDFPDVYEKGRRCVERGCGTYLNIYNPGPWCLLHAARHEDEFAALLDEAA